MEPNDNPNPRDQLLRIFDNDLISRETLQAAVAAVNDYTWARLREDGFFRRIMPPLRLFNPDGTPVRRE